MLALVESGQVGEVAFADQGFDRIGGLHFYVRSASIVPEELEIVERYGGNFPAMGLWEEMKGFSTAKELLELRIVAPLAHSELADSVGLRAPAAVMLFNCPPTPTRADQWYPVRVFESRRSLTVASMPGFI